MKTFWTCSTITTIYIRNELIKYYFKVPEKLKKYPGIPRTRLPRSIDKDIKQAVKKSHPTVLPVKQFISTKGLEDLRMLA